MPVERSSCSSVPWEDKERALGPVLERVPACYFPRRTCGGGARMEQNQPRDLRVAKTHWFEAGRGERPGMRSDRNEMKKKAA